MVLSSLAHSSAEPPAGAARLLSFGELSLQLAEQREPRALLDLAVRGARNLLGAAYAVLTAAGPADAAPYASFGGPAAAPLPPPPLESGWVGQIYTQRAPRRATVADGSPERL